MEYPAETAGRLPRPCPRAWPCADRGRDLPRLRQPHSGRRPHDLFADPDWADTLIQLYCFSKAYRLTGHRVGAIVASAARLAEVEKFLDTVAICPGQLGQIGALWGMRNLCAMGGGRTRRNPGPPRARWSQGFAALPGWKLLGCGAYFAYVEHPFDMASDALCKRLVDDASLLMLPGTMFQPEGSAAGKRQIRIAFANVDAAGIAEMFRRLAAFRRLTGGRPGTQGELGRRLAPPRRPSPLAPVRPSLIHRRHDPWPRPMAPTPRRTQSARKARCRRPRSGS